MKIPCVFLLMGLFVVAYHVTVDILQLEDLVGPIVPLGLCPVMRLQGFDDLTVKLDQSLLGGRVAAEVNGLNGGATSSTNPLHHFQRNLAQDGLHKRPVMEENIFLTLCNHRNYLVIAL